MPKNFEQNKQSTPLQTPDTLPKQNMIGWAGNLMKQFEKGTISKLIKLRELMARDVFQKTVKIQTEKPPSTLKVLGIVAASAISLSPLAVDYSRAINETMEGKNFFPKEVRDNIDLIQKMNKKREEMFMQPPYPAHNKHTPGRKQEIASQESKDTIPSDSKENVKINTEKH